MLRLDEMDNYKDESSEMINNEDIINQYQFVYNISVFEKKVTISQLF